MMTRSTMAPGFQLRACSDREERNGVMYLETVIPTNSFSMLDLERCFEHAISPITRILLASIVDGVVDSFENFTDIVSSVAENEEVCQHANPNTVSDLSISIIQVGSWASEIDVWASQNDLRSLKRAQQLKRLSTILETLRHDFEYPCDVTNYSGNGFATWSELRDAARSWMSCPHPKISDTLDLIRFLRKKPFLNLTAKTRPQTAAGVQQQDVDIDAFDSKMERFRVRFPIIDKLTDPSIVVIEPVNAAASAILPAHIAGIIATMAATSIYPLPSLVAPVNMPDPAGPPGATFAFTYSVANISEARTFAGILRAFLPDANLAGANGPPARIFVIHGAGANFRVF